MSGSIRPSDTPSQIAAKYLGGFLPGVSAEEAMKVIKRRAISMENKLEKAKEELERL